MLGGKSSLNRNSVASTGIKSITADALAAQFQA
jgi:hypothetical protein